MPNTKLPDWFNLDRYKWINSYADKQLYFEVAARGIIFHLNKEPIAPEEEVSDKSMVYKIITNADLLPGTSDLKHNASLTSYYEAIFPFTTGLQVHKMFSDGESYTYDLLMERNPSFRIPSGKYIKPINVEDVSSLNQSIAKFEGKNENFDSSIISVSTLTNGKHEFHYKINTAATDAALMKDFKELLKAIRQIAPYTKSNSRYRQPFKKIREKCYIPIFDLLIYQKISGTNISNKVLLDLTDENIEIKDFREKYIDQILNWSHPNNLPILHSYIDN